MILDHQKFDYGERRLIEKVTIKAPFRFAVDFPNDACFIYFEEGSTNVNAPYEQVAVGSGESILLYSNAAPTFQTLWPTPQMKSMKSL